MAFRVVFTGTETPTKAISASEDISSVSTFLTCAEAIEWSRNNPVDVAFLDINMRGMGGRTDV